MVVVHEVATADLCTFFSRTEVDVDFRARTARTCITHFPEVVLLVTVDDVVFWQVLFPVTSSFVVAVEAVFCATFEYGCVQVFRVQLQYIYQVFPCPSNRFFLEIVAERPVAEHFEHGVVISIVTYFFQVIVLTTYAETLLRVRYSLVFRRGIAQDNILELVHPCIGEHQSRVILNDHWSRRHNLVAFRLKETLERFSNFLSCHHLLYSLVVNIHKISLQR